jgi:hypothetical protein
MQKLLSLAPLTVGLFAVCSAASAEPLRFDFGSETSPVFPDFTRVSDKTVFTPESAFGFIGTAPSAYNRMRPNALAGDFVWSANKTTFRLNLPNGSYKAWFFYGDSRYDARVIVPLAKKNQIAINGKQALSDPLPDWKTFYSEKYYFRGYSDIYHANDDFYDKYVAPNFKESFATFEVNNGQALFQIEDIPLAAMIVYPVAEAPQAEDDIAYLHKELRRHTIISQVKETGLNPEPLYAEKDQQRGYVVYSRFPSQPPLAGDRPLLEELNPNPGAFLAAGQTANLSVTVLPLQDLKNVKVACSDLTDKSSGAKIAAESIKIEHVAHHETAVATKYVKTTAYSYRVSPTYIKPFPDVFPLMDKGINHTILLTVRADENTRPGVYGGHIRITPEGAQPQTVPVRVRVLPINLPELPIVAGRYAMDYDFYYYDYWNQTFKDASFRDFVWQREKQNMEWNKEMGLNSIAWTEARIGDITQNPADGANEQFIRWMDLYRDMGFKTMPWYGFQAITHSKRTFKGIPRFSPEWNQQYRQLIERLRDMGKERNWPEILFYLSDELSNDGNEGKEEGLKRAAASQGIEGVRRLASVNGKYEHPLIGQIDILMPNPAFPITQPIMDEMKAKGSELWLYNSTNQRFTWGYYPARIGAKGRFQWFGNYGPGYPFDDFDSTTGNSVYDAFVAGPDGPISQVNALDMREGLDDLRYLTLLKQLVEKNKNSQTKAAQDARAILQEIDALDVDLRNYAGSAISAVDTGFAVNEKMWTPQACERMRWRIAESIMTLHKSEVKP